MLLPLVNHIFFLTYSNNSPSKPKLQLIIFSFLITSSTSHTHYSFVIRISMIVFQSYELFYTSCLQTYNCNIHNDINHKLHFYNPLQKSISNESMLDSMLTQNDNIYTKSKFYNDYGQRKKMIVIPLNSLVSFLLSFKH